MTRLQKSAFWQVFMNYEGNVPLTTKGGATRALGKLNKLKLLFFLTNNDSQQLMHSWHDIQVSNKEGFGHAMEHTWSFKVLMFLNKHWTVYVSVCKSVFFVVSLLEASPVHETLWDTKRGSPKVWKSDISCLMAILQMTREHFIFNAWKMTAVLE